MQTKETLQKAENPERGWVSTSGISPKGTPHSVGRNPEGEPSMKASGVILVETPSKETSQKARRIEAP